MATNVGLIREIDDAIAQGSNGRRSEILRRVTDLFIAGATLYSDEEISLFDDVIKRLAAEIELSARALLAARLAPIPNAPPGAIRLLAFDDAIEVAEPILVKSAQLDDATLTENAKEKGQRHMLAISQRAALSPLVTDVLVECGDREVVLRAVKNPGAKFSDKGFSVLIERSDGDDELSMSVGSRTEIPAYLFIVLLAKASAMVRTKLESLHPLAKYAVRRAVAEAASQLQDEKLGTFRDLPLVETSRGDEFDKELNALAKAGGLAETTEALAAMCRLPGPFVEQAMTEARSETILILTKAIGLSWPTVKTILSLRAQKRCISPEQIGQCLASFERLKLETAQEILKFYRMRGVARPTSLEQSQAAGKFHTRGRQ